jgi:hypothetical protein
MLAVSSEPVETPEWNAEKFFAEHPIAEHIKSESYGGWSAKDFATTPRGRATQRPEVTNSSSYSRNSSASSARSMIDERMEWANEERSRSFSRPALELVSPFRESSPYHPDRQKSQYGAWGVPTSLLLTEPPKKSVFDTQGSSDELDHQEQLKRYVTRIGCLRLSVDFDRELKSEELNKRRRCANFEIETQRRWHPDEATHFERVKQAFPEDLFGKDDRNYLIRRFKSW